MSVLTIKLPPDAPAEWPCVDCGLRKDEHKKINGKLVCFPLVLVGLDEWAHEYWRQFR